MIKTTSHLPILEPVLKLALPSYPVYSNSLPLLSLTFYGPPPPPPSFTRFCDTHISSLLHEVPDLEEDKSKANNRIGN